MVTLPTTDGSRSDTTGTSNSTTMALTIPDRPADASTATQLEAEFQTLPAATRDGRVLWELESGNMPTFMRNLMQVTATATINGASHTLVYSVIPDYLSVGSDQDYLRIPMTPLTAQTAADALNATLPSTLMVDQIWQASTARTLPWGFDPENGAFEVFVESNDKIESQLAELGLPLGSLVSGDKKDVVTTVQLAANPGHVAIYGWQNPTTGENVQELFLGHDIDYVDYSQCFRLVCKTALLDGNPVQILDILADPSLNVLISKEGPVTAPRYVGPATVPIAPPGGPPSEPPSQPSTGTGQVLVGNGICQTPADTLGLDRSASIGPQAAELYTAGYRFAIRYVTLPGLDASYNLTAAEATQIRQAGLALGLYQLYRQHNITEAQGTTDGQYIASQASAIGFPKGSVMFCDLESSDGYFYDPSGAKVTAQTMIAYLQNWAAAVISAGYIAGLYSGPQALLQTSDLANLTKFSAFWAAGATVPDAPCGYQLKQQNANKMVCGINIDEDVTQADLRANLPLFWAPSAVPTT